MVRIHLASGRKVSIERLDIENIYSGVLEGTPEMVAKMHRRSLAERIKNRFWDTAAVLILGTQEPTLPQYRCIAHFHSAPVKADNYYSYLLVCWFVDDLDVKLPAMAKQILDSIDWDAHAEDVSIDDM